MEALLAVDLGLRTGLAEYGADGRLRRYGSHNFGNRTRHGRAAHREVHAIDALAALVVEGDGRLARPWLEAAEERGAETFAIHAHAWRPALLLARERRTGADAKRRADEIARRIVDHCGARRPTSLTHDAAEAILIGWWGCMQLGWVDGPPPPTGRRSR